MYVVGVDDPGTWVHMMLHARDLLVLDQPREERLVVAFTQVMGFAKACLSKADEAIVQTLDRYYEIVTAAVDGAGGVVVKFIGDASLVVFLPERATDGVAALHEIKDAATPVWAEFDSSCEVQANAGIGTVICGPVGPGSTRRFDVIGKLVNEVAKMPRDGVTLSQQLRELVET